MEKDSYSVLAEYYGLDEHTIMDCVDQTQEHYENILDHNQIADIIAEKIENPSSLLDILVTLLVKIKYIDCDDHSAHIISSGRVPFQAEFDDEDTTNLMLKVGDLSINVYRGNLDESDPFQTERRIFLEISLRDREEVVEFTNEEVVDLTAISRDARRELDVIPGLTDALHNKLTDEIIDDFVEWGNYIRFYCPSQ